MATLNDVGRLFRLCSKELIDTVTLPSYPPHIPSARYRDDLYGDGAIAVTAGSMGIKNDASEESNDSDVETDLVLQAFCHVTYFRYHYVPLDHVIKASLGNPNIDARIAQYQEEKKKVQAISGKLQTSISGLPRTRNSSGWDNSWIITFVHFEISLYDFKAVICNLVRESFKHEEAEAYLSSQASPNRAQLLTQIKTLVKNALANWEGSIKSKIATETQKLRSARNKRSELQHYIAQLEKYREEAHEFTRTNLDQLANPPSRALPLPKSLPWYHELASSEKEEFWVDRWSLDVAFCMYRQFTDFIDIEANFNDAYYGDHMLTAFAHLALSVHEHYLRFFADASVTRCDDQRANIFISEGYSKEHHARWRKAATLNNQEPDCPKSYDTVMIPSTIFGDGGKRKRRRVK